MRINVLMRQAVATVGFSVLCGGLAHAASGSITVSNPGPLGSFSINTAVFNGTSGQIDSLTFDLSGTHCLDGGSCILGESMVFGGSGGGSFAYDPEANGTSSLFGAVGAKVFGFNYTGNDPLNVFVFSWDPDVASNGGYGAVVAELAGTKITASVRFGDGSTLLYKGTMGAVGPDVSANLSPVPEPASYAMLLAGFGVIGALARRKAHPRAPA